MSRRNSKKVARPGPKSNGRQPAIEGPDFSKVPPVPRIFGYYRVSREDQNPDMQITALKNSGCDRLFGDKLSGRTDRRPEWRRVRKHLQPGDALKVYAMSRLFRNLQQIDELIREFNANNITLITLTEGINIRTSQGKLQARIAASFDEAEVDRLANRTRDGMAERKRQGAVFGRPRVVSKAQIKQMKKWRGKVPAKMIADRMHCSVASVYNNW